MNGSPAYRSGAWLYEPLEHEGAWFVAATWPTDDAPTWGARLAAEVHAERGAVQLAAGQLAPDCLNWEPLDIEADIVGLAS